jgi:mannose-6-phosphate isomerase-like protein (cupin superfamily)
VCKNKNINYKIRRGIMKITPNDYIKETRTNMRDGEGDVIIEHFQKEGLPEKCRLMSKITLEPGCSIGHHVHKNETEYYIIAKGEAVVDDDGTDVFCKAGDVIVTPDGFGHSIKNTGSETMEMIAVIILD